MTRNDDDDDDDDGNGNLSALQNALFYAYDGESYKNLKCPMMGKFTKM